MQKIPNIGVSPWLAGLLTIVLISTAAGQDTDLSPRAKARDANNNNLIERSEAGGPLAENFDVMDCDKNGGLDGKEIRGFFTGAGCPKPAAAKIFPPLSPRGKARDANNNNLIERSEAGGPLAENFDTMDCDKNGGLDANEIRGFFTGAGCPKPGTKTASLPPPDPKALNPRGKAADANNNGVIDRDEAGGPLLANFNTIDKDKSGTLDGAEIKNFFVNRTNSTPAAKPKNAAPRQFNGRLAPTVQLDQVISQPVGQTFPTIGRLVARQSGVIAAKVAGAIEEMRVNVGDRLAKNDVIAVLNTDRPKAERDRWAAIVGQRTATLEAARAELKKTVQEAQRIEDLRSSAVFSRARMEDVAQDVASRKGTVAEREAQLAEAQVQLRRSNLDLVDATVRAPFNGIIVEKHIDVGSYVRVGDRFVTLLNDRDIEVEAEIPTDQIYSLEAGAPVSVVLDDGSIHDANVRAIVPQENPRTRTRSVRFTPKFRDLKKSLAADQSVTVRIPLGAARAVTVHKDAIVRRGTKAVVYIVRDSRAFARQVDLGRGVSSRFIVTKGLEPGDMVVVRGNERLGGGGPVKVIQLPSAEAKK